jgi:hypothetical protein
VAGIVTGCPGSPRRVLDTFRADHSTGSADILPRRTKARNNMTQNKSDLLTKLVPIALVATAALWLVVILITDFPAWTLAVYVALAIPAIQRFSRSNKNAQRD